MKLYYSKGACSFSPRIIINELNIECEFEAVDLKTKQTQSGKNYLEINPKGSVPALVIDSNKVLTEGPVILQYLAEKFAGTALLPKNDDFNHYRELEWLNFITSDIHKIFGPFFNPTMPQEIRDKIYTPLLKSKFSFVDKTLQQNKYLMGDTFTLPDAYFFVMVTWANVIKLDITECKNVLRYYAELLQRPSIKKSMEQEM